MDADHGAARELLECAVAYGLVEGALWTLGRTQLFWATAAALWVLVTTVLSGRTSRETGVGATGLRRSWWLIPSAAVICALMVGSAYHYGTLHILRGTHTPPWHAALYAVWALVQQFLTQSYIFVRLESALGSGRSAVFWTALLFSAAHIPNGVLVPATFAAGLVLTWTFYRYRNLYPLAITHAMFGLALAISLPDAVSHHMRVGMSYFLG